MLRLLYALISCLLLVSCVGHETITGQPTTGLDRKLTTFSFMMISSFIIKKHICHFINIHS